MPRLLFQKHKGQPSEERQLHFSAAEHHAPRDHGAPRAPSPQRDPQVAWPAEGASLMPSKS